MNEELDRLDRLLAQLAQVLDAPGESADSSPEASWQRLDLLYAAMGADALRATLRRQGMDSATIGEALDRLGRRRSAISRASQGD
ncbi:MAG: hypothetical protein M3Z06_03955 [Actinomycetota bacterium]|nr:hypothetical protein [Actinomycetota bacterium]